MTFWLDLSIIEHYWDEDREGIEAGRDIGRESRNGEEFMGSRKETMKLF